MKRGGRRILCIAVQALAGLAPVAAAYAQSAAEVLGPAGVAPLTAPQPPARIIVDAPLPGPLSEGMVFIQYRAVNLRIEPVFGPNALAVTPRIGHVHVVVDGAPCWPASAPPAPPSPNPRPRRSASWPITWSRWTACTSTMGRRGRASRWC